jgi:hypothetical protein
MKKITILLLILLLNVGMLMAQETEQKERPVSAPFESGILIDNQTAYIPDANTLEFVLDHRFGPANNGIKDMFGLYAPSNIRLGLNYSIKDYLMIGVGVIKDRKLTDFRLKFNLFRQTRSNKIPVGITIYGNFAIDGRADEVFGEAYEFKNRYSFFGQVIFSRKFSNAISLQISPSFSHINSTLPGLEHDKWGLSFSGRVKFSPQSAFIFNYDVPLHIESMQENLELGFISKPNLGVGVEFSTGTHVFQIFLGTADALNPQYNMLANDNNIGWGIGEKSGMMLGFTMTRLWSF